MFDYAEIRNGTAEPLIAEFGTDGTLLVNSGAGTNPWDAVIDSEVEYDIKVLRSKFTSADNQGTLVEYGDVLFLVSTEGVVVYPGMADRIQVDGVTYQIVRMDPIQPGPLVMLWKVQARK